MPPRARITVLVPARTPRELVQKRNVEINKALTDPAIRRACPATASSGWAAPGSNGRLYPRGNGALAENRQSWHLKSGAGRCVA